MPIHSEQSIILSEEQAAAKTRLRHQSVFWRVRRGSDVVLIVLVGIYILSQLLRRSGLFWLPHSRVMLTDYGVLSVITLYLAIIVSAKLFEKKWTKSELRDLQCLSTAKDKNALGLYVEALVSADYDIRKLAIGHLFTELPKLTFLDKGLLNSYQISILNDRISIPFLRRNLDVTFDSAVVIMEALSKIGDRNSIERMMELHEIEPVSQREAHIAELSGQCLATIQNETGAG